MDGGAWWTTVHGGRKELDTTERLHFHFGIYGSSDSKEPACIAGDLNLILGLRKSPGEGNGNPSSILVWRIPWTEKPGGQQSKGVSKS